MTNIQVYSTKKWNGILSYQKTDQEFNGPGFLYQLQPYSKQRELFPTWEGGILQPCTGLSNYNNN